MKKSHSKVHKHMEKAKHHHGKAMEALKELHKHEKEDKKVHSKLKKKVKHSSY